MGMGGAVMALPSSPEGSWYNPALLVSGSGGLFSGSLQFFGTDRQNLKEGFVAPGFPRADLSSASFLALPSSSVLQESFGDKDQHVVAFSSFLGAEVDERFGESLTRSTPLAPNLMRQITLSSARQQTDRIFFSGPSYAVRLSPDLALGVSAYYARRDQTTGVVSGVVERRTDADTEALSHSVFGDASSSTDVSDGALVMRLGALYRVSPSFAVAAVITPESIPLHGDGGIDYAFRFSGDPVEDDASRREPTVVAISARGLEALTVYPWMFGVGAALAPSPSVRLGASVNLTLPSAYKRLALSASQEGIVGNHFVNDVEHQLQVNGALGLEWKVTDAVPLRLGAFTNRTTAPPIPQLPTRPMAPNVDLYGVTASVGFLGEKRALNIGGELQLGQGDDVVLADVADVWNPEFLRVDRDHFRAVLFISGAFEFARSSASELLELE